MPYTMAIACTTKGVCDPDCRGHKQLGDMFSTRSTGQCGKNTSSDRQRRKDRARELTRINMQRKEEFEV